MKRDLHSPQDKSQELVSEEVMMMQGNIRDTLQFFLDPKVPFSQKIWPLLGGLYLLSPIDLIPDPFLGIGFLDDILFIIFVYMKMKRTIEEYKMGKTYPGKQTKDDYHEGMTIDHVEYKVRED